MVVSIVLQQIAPKLCMFLTSATILERHVIKKQYNSCGTAGTESWHHGMASVHYRHVLPYNMTFQYCGGCNMQSLGAICRSTILRTMQFLTSRRDHFFFLSSTPLPKATHLTHGGEKPHPCHSSPRWVTSKITCCSILVRSSTSARCVVNLSQ
jgi:hypothetical protein